MDTLYIIASIVLSMLNTAIILCMSYKFLHTYQLNGYHFVRMFNWFGNTNARYFKRLLMICALSLGALFVTNIVFSGYAHDVFTYLGLVFYFVLSILFIRYEGKIPKKKPLVFTRRIIRQYMVLGILSIAGNLALFYLNFEMMKLGGVFLHLRFAIIALTPIVLPVLFVLSSLITAPLELLNNKRYTSRARRILDERRDLIKIGITGSYAKTSVKTILATILSKKYQVLATPASFNTPLGVTKCVKKLKSNTEIFIAEMGARNGGNIRELCNMVNPTYGIITGISNQHLETFGNITNIVKTKCELAESLAKRNGRLYINSDTSHLDKLKKYIQGDYIECGINGGFVSATNYSLSDTGSEFDLLIDGKAYPCKTKLLGKHNISNILACVGLAVDLGVEIDDIVSAISELEAPSHRLELIVTGKGMKILDDTFNANSEGALAALNILKLFDGRKVIVTPGLVELGLEEKKTNKNFGKQIADVCDLVFLIGKIRSTPIKEGLLESGFSEDKILVYNSLSDAKRDFKKYLSANDVVLLENDLPDDYNEVDELK